MIINYCVVCYNTYYYLPIIISLRIILVSIYKKYILEIYCLLKYILEIYRLLKYILKASIDK
jgi:hypothetical protein